VRRLLLPAALVAGLALALSACGSKTETTSAGRLAHVTLELDFFPNADHAALYTAIANGYFRQAGIDVSPQTPADPSEPLKLLAAGRADIAISYEPELLLARDAGEKLVAIGALVQRPLTSIIAPASAHVRNLSDLSGKQVGTAGIPYQSAMLGTVLQSAGVGAASVKEIDVGFNLVPAMLSGHVAATLGGYWNYEGIQLQQMNRNPTVIPVDRAGVPTYDELVLVVRAQTARTRGPLLRAFMQALARGDEAVKADPRAAVKDLLAANPALSGRLQLASVTQTLPATLPPSARLPYGWQDPAAWQRFGQWMAAHKLIHSAAAESFSLTNEFLPGQGVPGTGTQNTDIGGP
jgi:putative hydroxymethylpyrimidine transport system substrate-binding protein